MNGIVRANKSRQMKVWSRVLGRRQDVKELTRIIKKKKLVSYVHTLPVLIHTIAANIL